MLGLARKRRRFDWSAAAMSHAVEEQLDSLVAQLEGEWDALFACTAGMKDAIASVWACGLSVRPGLIQDGTGALRHGPSQECHGLQRH